MKRYGQNIGLWAFSCGLRYMAISVAWVTIFRISSGGTRYDSWFSVIMVFFAAFYWTAGNFVQTIAGGGKP